MSELRVSSSDLPALHRAASDSSAVAQSRYLLLLRLDLLALVLGGLLTSVQIDNPSFNRWIAAAGAVLLVASLILVVMISVKNYEQRWYGGRAVAESVKTLSWRYMTGAEPFKIDLPPQHADNLFVDQLRDVLEQSELLAVRLGRGSADREITDKMRRVRAASVEERRDLYITDRVRDQRAWYSSRSEDNEGREHALFVLMMFVQLAAVAAAVFSVAQPRSPLRASGLLTMLAIALLAWLQVKRHQELAQSYAVAAHELGLIAEEAEYVDTEERLSVFVADAEAAVSREHTLWVARRDVPAIRPRPTRGT